MKLAEIKITKAVLYIPEAELMKHLPAEVVKEGLCLLYTSGLIKRAGYGLYIHLVNDESGESDESSKKSVSDETQLNFHLPHGDSPEVSSGAGEAVKVKSPSGGSLKGSFTTFTTYTKAVSYTHLDVYKRQIQDR